MGTDSARPVVVGVSGSGDGTTTIKLAATEADYRQVPLVAVMVYSSGGTVGAAPAARPISTLRTGDDDRAVAEAQLQDEVQDALGEQASRAELRTLPGLAGRKLVETAQQAPAQLIVLASRKSTSGLIGSVSQYVLRNHRARSSWCRPRPFATSRASGSG
ncbi:MAG TPA: universal stress protein [Streptosporangiaceae bacterium]|nr:universal stress protein [Streptosporangiaceae bacterium]